MTSRVPCRAAAPLTVVLVVAAAVFFGAAPTAHASDGAEVGFLGGGLVLAVAGLDTTFIVATATGLIYDDPGWAVAQLAWSIASIAAAGVGVGYALDAGFPGLAGGAALGALGSSILLGYAIDALVRPDGDRDEGAGKIRLGVAPTEGGALLSLFWRA